MKMNGLSCVRVEWLNHNSVLCENQWKLFASQRFPKHELTCEGKVIDVHFAILEALCDNFSSDKCVASVSHAYEVDLESRIRFTINGVSCEVVDSFLEFVYRGRCVFPADCLKAFLALVLQARVRDLDRLQVEFFDDKDERREAIHEDQSQKTDELLDEASLNEYFDICRAWDEEKEEDWYAMKLAKENSLDNNRSSAMESSADLLTNLEDLYLSIQKVQSCFYIDDILRRCSCLVKEQLQKFTVTFSELDYRLEKENVGGDCGICSAMVSSISVTAERINLQEDDPDYFLNGYASLITRDDGEDDAESKGSQRKETFSTELSDFCSGVNLQVCCSSELPDKPVEANLNEPRSESVLGKPETRIETEVVKERETFAIEPSNFCSGMKSQVCCSNESQNQLVESKPNEIETRKVLSGPLEISKVKKVIKKKIAQAKEENKMEISETKETNDLENGKRCGVENCNVPPFKKVKRDNKRGKFFCDKCFYQCSSVFEIKCHRMMQHVKHFKCEDCGESFSGRSALPQHIANRHCQLSDFPKCTLCTYRTPWWTVMERHKLHNHASLGVDESKFQGMKTESTDGKVPDNLKMLSETSEPQKVLEKSTHALKSVLTTRKSLRVREKSEVKKLKIEQQQQQQLQTPNSHSLKKFTCPKCDFQSEKSDTLLEHVKDEHFNSS